MKHLLVLSTSLLLAGISNAQQFNVSLAPAFGSYTHFNSSSHITYEKKHPDFSFLLTMKPV